MPQLRMPVSKFKLLQMESYPDFRSSRSHELPVFVNRRAPIHEASGARLKLEARY